MKTLLDVYTSMARVAHWVADKEGQLSLVRGPVKKPVLVNGKRLVLPTDEQLNRPGGDTIVFHPLYEFIPRGESEVVAEFRMDLTWRFHFSFLAFANELLTLAASQQTNSLLTPEQSEFLSFVPDADEQMLETFGELVNAMPEGQNQKAFCSIFLRKGGVLHGKSYHRAAIVNFPLYKQLIEDGEVREAEMQARKARSEEQKKKDKSPPPVNETYGVAMRGKDREAYIKLFEYMLPDIGMEHAYSIGSNSKISPMISALMHAATLLSTPLNNLVELFDSRLSENAKTILRVEDAWMPVFENLAPWQVEIRKIPAQEGNGGKTASQEAMKAEAEATYVPGEVHNTAHRQVERLAEEQAVEAPRAPVGFRLPTRSTNQPPMHQPAPYVPPPPPQPYVQPQVQQQPYPPQQQYHPGAPYPQVQQPVPQQQYHQPAPTMGPRGGGGGMDFNDLMRSQPALQAVAATTYNQYPQGAPSQYQQRALPTWATEMTGTQRPTGQQYQQGQPHPTMGQQSSVPQGYSNDPYRSRL